MARITLLAPDLARGPVYTAAMFGGALEERHDAQIVGPRAEALWPPLADELAPALVLPSKNPLGRDVRQAALAATGDTDLVYAFKPFPASFGLGLWIRRRRDLPLALHLDDWDSGYFAEAGWMRRAWYGLRGLPRPEGDVYVRLLEHRAASADLVTVSTRVLQRRFGGSVVRQGVDSDRFAPERFPRDEARRRLGIEPDRPVVAFTGTPSMHKGLQDLIAAVDALPASLGAQLLVVGTPPDPTSAAVLAAAGERVVVRDSVPFGEVAWYIAAADVLCAPQRATPFGEHQLPAKILHWMTLGACVVATDVGDAGELVGGDPPAGRIVPAGDTDAMRDAIAALLDDPARRAELGSAARARAVERYSWRAMGRELEPLLQGIGL